MDATAGFGDSEFDSGVLTYTDQRVPDPVALREMRRVVVPAATSWC
jgi:hypothetical protein